MIFVDESIVNEYTMNQKFGWFSIDTSAIHVQSLKWFEKRSILSIYIIKDFSAWDIIQDSYNIELFNEFVRNWIISSTNSFLESHFIFIINKIRICRFKIYIISFLN